MASETVQGNLQKLNLVCKISSVTKAASSPEQVAGKQAKGIVAARSEGKKLLLSNDQTKSDIIK